MSIGYDPENLESLQMVAVLNLTSLTWTQLPSRTDNKSVTSSKAYFKEDENRIYFFNGRDVSMEGSPMVAEAEYFDLETEEWHSNITHPDITMPSDQRNTVVLPDQILFIDSD